LIDDEVVMSGLYSVQDVVSNFDTKDYERGTKYAKLGRVIQVTFDGRNRLTGLVQGSDNKPYEVEARIFDRGAEKAFEGQCSCPVGYKCKHMVATLLVGMEQLVDKGPRLDHKVTDWLKAFDEKPVVANEPGSRFLIYIIEPQEEGFAVQPSLTSILKKGTLSTSSRTYYISDLENYKNRESLRDNDLTILRFMAAFSNDRYASKIKIPAGKDGELILKWILETGRCYLPNAVFPENRLVMGEARKASLGWAVNKDATQIIQVQGLDYAKIIRLQELYYICSVTKKVGLLDLGLSQGLATKLLKAPAIQPEQVVAIKKKLAGIASPEVLPAEFPMRELSVQPIPQIRLSEVRIQPVSNDWSRRPLGDPASVAVIALSFNYGGKSIAYNDTSPALRHFKDGEVLIIKRNSLTEIEMKGVLQKLGFTTRLEDVMNHYSIKHQDRSYLTLGRTGQKFHKDNKIQSAWEHFMKEWLPRLCEQGWQVKMDKNFPYNIVYPDDEWYAEVEEGSGIDWFGFELGVTIEGKRLNLVPILLELLKKDDDIFDIIRKLPKDKPLLIPIEDGRRIALQPERAKALLTTLQHLFSFHNGELDEEGKLKLQKLEAALLAEMEAAMKSLNLRWFGGERIRTLGQKLKGFSSVKSVRASKLFHGQLRNYQQDGLNWLQFLQEYELAGILADDMGLGKTVQILAHIAKEKSAKQLKALPFLVIAPTSLMANWKLEAKRFVPDLKVLTLHGFTRKEHFKDIKDYDLVLTTYPLLIRDKEILTTHEYHTVVLDEAQIIKNAKAKSTQIVNQLKAKHRLCMTGTPIENNLGELWSLFNFLLPGYLGTSEEFNNLFRTPIEKAGNLERSQILARRIKPFVLRRTKQEVATELPPKTEIVRTIELEGEQRDLYETIRASMHKKVREEIKAKGVGRSHIIVLDALLKLRQVCCDPELLKTATKLNQSAKRDELMTMLTTMLKEGRKILLFSQFTSMLALIERELAKEKLPYVILTGQTQDRETPVQQFQEGKIPLFLISLKAGGIGLNLTAADTVIHYDPWWNPAVENQATDRAYRIGQDKPVFVYKLITSGTVEEKILEMQAKKRQLMDNLFDPSAKASTKLTADDIQSLFEPLR
jgi:superfamily II DNA or RNA helicase